MKILLVDDHSLTRRAICSIIADAFPDANISEAGDIQTMFDILSKKNQDILLLDLSLPDKSGLDSIKQIKRLYPELPVLVLSSLDEEAFALPALKHGASGYLHKEQAIDKLAIAINSLLKNDKYISTKIVQQLLTGGASDSAKQPHELLSEREFSVMCMLARGKTVSEISQELYLSPKTISTYRIRILEKLDLRRNTDLTLYCIKHNLLDDSIIALP